MRGIATSSWAQLVLALSGAAVLVSPVPARAQLAQTPLNILWRVEVPVSYGIDFMSTTGVTERNEFTSDGAIFYIPQSTGDGQGPLYREYASSVPDHMESVILGEGGYTTEGTLGYPWTTSSAKAGLSQIARVSDSHGDHATIHPNEVLTGHTTTEGFNRYGYARFNDTAPALLTVSGGGISIGSNPAAGGAIFSWTWNGVQFVDTADFGREIQSDFFYQGADGVWANPNEAGDYWSCPAVAVQDQHGSPSAVMENLSSSVQRTRSIPLEWMPTNWPGGGTYATCASTNPGVNPIVYADAQIGKDITLGWNGITGVVQYITHVIVPVQITGTSIEIPTGYAPALWSGGTGEFDYYWTWDATSNPQLTRVYPPYDCGAGNFEFNASTGCGSGYCGVIISDANSLSSNAMGIFGVLSSNGGPVEYFTLWDMANSCSANTSKWSAVYQGTIPAGESTYTTWIVTGTLSDVTASMQQLYTTLAP